MPDLLGSFSYTWPWYAAGLIAYLVGAIPFGLILHFLATGRDIRGTGSGNIGATNVLRSGHKLLALITLFLDIGKGFLVVVMAGIYGPDFCVITAAAVVIGHIFPVWLRFRGGKGVATALGVITALSWPIGLVAGAVWLIVAKITRYSSLSALIAIPTAPLALLLMLRLQRDGALPLFLPGEPQFIGVLWLIAGLVILRHAGNIRRLLGGDEPKIGARSGGPVP